MIIKFITETIISREILVNRILNLEGFALSLILFTDVLLSSPKTVKKIFSINFISSVRNNLDPFHKRILNIGFKHDTLFIIFIIFFAILFIILFSDKGGEIKLMTPLPESIYSSIAINFMTCLTTLVCLFRSILPLLKLNDTLSPHQSKEETIYEELRTRFTSHNLINDVSNLKVYISILKQEEPQLLSKFSILEEMTLMIEDTITKFRNSDSIRTKNPFMLHELFDNFLILNKPDLVREESNLQIIYQIPDYKNLEIHQIFYEVYQVLNNLISNARKAIAKTEYKEIQIFTLVETDRYIVFQVSDTGVGIDSKARNRIFDIGYSTTNGDGLGLLFVQPTLKRFGGEISHLPNALSGFSTTFEVKIPIQKTT